MTARQLVCMCEDVTDAEILRAFDAGFQDMESVKRFTGVGTGSCQGRQCLARVARLLHGRGVAPEKLAPTTTRPPLWPVPLGVLAAEGDLPPTYPGPLAPALWSELPMPAPPDRLETQPDAAQVVIVGGGVMGLATAYHLAKNGIRDVVVLERSYLNAGASGRNGGGIRQQWSTEQNVLLMKESVKLCRGLAKELGINVWLRQGGYLFVALSAAHLEAAERNVAMQNRLGVKTRMLRPKEALRLAPELNIADVRGASFNPDDGVIFPWPFLFGYAEKARRHGARILTFTEVLGIDVQNRRVAAVHTGRGTIRCDLLINAAGAWSPAVAHMAGVKLPNKPERHEILVCESLKSFLRPLVSELGTGLYFSQSMRGEVVGGLGDPDEPAGLEMRSSLRFLQRMARALVHRMPRLAAVKVLRQWAGCYDVTPDRNPVVGEVSEVSGFFQLNGFVGHGFMMAPAIGKLVGEHLAKGREHPFLRANRLSRFQDDSAAPRETLIIG